MKLHESIDEFKSLIVLTAEYKHIPQSAVLRDYYIVMLLGNLAESEYADKCVFKGGTSLSKCYPGSIERFSEDIDLTFLRMDLSNKECDKTIKKIEEIITQGAQTEKIPSECSDRSKSMWCWFGDRADRVKLEICIPNESIEDTPPAGLPDLNQIILVYCRSGRRSKEAAQKLFDMGYTRVYEFGGIIDWIGETMKNEEDHSMDPIAIPGLLVGDRYYTFDFESNSSADAFFEKIKKKTLTIVMHDQDSSGKIGDLPWELPANDFEMTAEPGNIILCAGGRIMLCYGESTGSYTKLGSIGDVTGEEPSEVLGAGDVTAEFSVEWTE